MLRKRRKFTSRQKTILYIRSDGKCAECGNPLERGWHADHRVPFSKGGETVVSNGAAKCRTCNLRKGDRTSEEQNTK